MDIKTDGMSMDIEQAERDKLQSLFPQCPSHLAGQGH